MTTATMMMMTTMASYRWKSSNAMMRERGKEPNLLQSTTQTNTNDADDDSNDNASDNNDNNNNSKWHTNDRP